MEVLISELLVLYTIDMPSYSGTYFNSYVDSGTGFVKEYAVAA